MNTDVRALAKLVIPEDPCELEGYGCQEPWEEFLKELSKCICGVGDSVEAKARTIESHRNLVKKIFENSYKLFRGEGDIEEEYLYHDFDSCITFLTPLLDDHLSEMVVTHLIAAFESKDDEKSSQLVAFLEFVRSETYNDEEYYIREALNELLLELKSVETENSKLLVAFIES